MGRLSLAWRVLTNGELAQQLSELVAGEAAERITEQPVAEPEPAPAVRNDAVTLLAALQREARLVDFLMEPIDDYADAQIGAAVRDIHRDSRTVLDRVFAIVPVIDQPEGSAVDLSNRASSGRLRLIGETDPNQKSGTLTHHGWKSARCELPTWSGSSQSVDVIAPAEVEVG
ncbi:MAG: DUF2760 domain-containing protein [Fuerstiella sp.]|nr:DUF2760 domain-containing protein [Fuerstiella sp.]MCP4855900.1 DUF2760 domain-containing protein [Fuerstiella sp.]